MKPKPQKKVTKHTPKPILFLARVFFVFGLLASGANAALIVTYAQQGLDVVVTATGSLNMSGATLSGSIGFPVLRDIRSDPDRVLSAVNGDDVYKIANGGDLFTQTVPLTSATSFSGDSFGLYASNTFTQFLLYVPDGFSSGTISGSLTFSNVQLADFGAIEQTVSWGASPDQSVTIQVIPEPSSILLFAIVATGFLKRRRRRT